MTICQATHTPLPSEQAGHLLIVEDYPDFLECLTLVFAQAAYTVTAVSTLREASFCLQMAAYDVVISDYRLGDGTGDTLVRQAQQQSPQPLTILMSADVQVPHVAQACGADAWYFKGDSYTVLTTLVHQLRHTRICSLVANGVA